MKVTVRWEPPPDSVWTDEAAAGMVGQTFMVSMPDGTEGQGRAVGAERDGNAILLTIEVPRPKFQPPV